MKYLFVVLVGGYRNNRMTQLGFAVYAEVLANLKKVEGYYNRRRITLPQFLAAYPRALIGGCPPEKRWLLGFRFVF